MATLEAIGKNEIPVIPQGRLADIKSDGLVYRPSATLRIESPLNKIETLAWYRDQLIAQGWVLADYTNGWTTSKNSQNGVPYFPAERRSLPCGKDWLIKENLRLAITEVEGKAIVEITLEGDYFWDWPPKFAAQMTFSVINLGAYGAIWLEQRINKEMTRAAFDMVAVPASRVLGILF